MPTTSEQIEANANVIKAHLKSILIDIKEHNASVLTDEHVDDLTKLVGRCNRILDSAKYIREQNIQLGRLTVN